MIINKYSAIHRHKVVPLHCLGCGFVTTVRRPDGPTAKALINAGYFYELQNELKLLRRAEALFVRFPESLHQLKASHEHKTPNMTPSEHDVAFAAELAKDQELSDHLLSAGFLLSARLSFLTEAVDEFAENLKVNRFACTGCGSGILAPEPEFFSKL